MKTEKLSPDEWWAGMDGERRAFFRDVMALARSVGEGQVLGLEFNGRNFTPSLRGGSGKAGTGAGAPDTGMQQGPELWWANQSAGMRGFVVRLAGLVEELERDRDKAVEIRRTEHGLKAALVLKFKKPVGGRARGN